MNKIVGAFVAIIRRDALVAATQPSALAMRLFAIVVSMSTLSFMSKLIDPARFTAHRDLGSYFSYVSVNVAFMIIQGSALLTAAVAVRSDQVSGALEYIIASQRRAWAYVLACAMFPLMTSCVEVVLALAVARFFGLSLGKTNFATLGLFVILSTLMMLALGIGAAAGVIWLKRLPPTGYLIGGAAPLLSGALFPRSLLPPALRDVGWLLPLTHALHGIRASVAGVSFWQIRGEFVWMSCATALLFPIAVVCLELGVAKGRRDGSLAHY